MSGPVLAIELAEAVPHPAIQRLREFLVRSSARVEEKRVGKYDFAVPWLRVGLILVVGVLAGVLAGLRPARHAARLNVLRALSHA